MIDHKANCVGDPCTCRTNAAYAEMRQALAQPKRWTEEIEGAIPRVPHYRIRLKCGYCYWEEEKRYHHAVLHRAVCPRCNAHVWIAILGVEHGQ